MNVTLPIQQLINQFLSEQDIATSSRGEYAKALARFFLWCHGNDINQRDVKREHIILYKAELNADGYSTMTIDFRLTVLRKFYQWMEQQGYSINPTLGIKNFKKYNGFKKDSLTTEQVTSLLEVVPTDSIHGLRNKAIIILMLVNGLREVEITRMNFNDLNMVKGRCLIKIQGKGKKAKDTEIVIEPEALDAINDYLVKRKDIKADDPLFSVHAFMRNDIRLRPVYVSQMITGYMVKAGVKSDRISPHSLRHTAAVFALKGGLSIYDVQLFLRHTSPNITEIYTRSIENEIRLENKPSKLLVNLIIKNKNTSGNMPRKEFKQPASAFNSATKNKFFAV